MSRDKQIEEMAFDLCLIDRCKHLPQEECHNTTCAHCEAEALYNAGYRKIPTTDWLTKGVPQEQIEREKEDAFAEVAERLGYRKQSEGEWLYNPDGMDWGLGAWQCSLCGCSNNSLPMDRNIKPLQWAGAKYCGNCGAKMKGGAE